MAKEQVFVLRTDLVIPAGTQFTPAPYAVQRISPHFEALYSEHNDSTASVCIDEDFIAEHAEYFVELR